MYAHSIARYAIVYIGGYAEGLAATFAVPRAGRSEKGGIRRHLSFLSDVRVA